MSIKDKIKQNITLVIGLSIPVFMILFVAASIYLPRIFTQIPDPQFDFVYTTNDFQYSHYWRVENGKLRQEKIETSGDFIPPHKNVARDDVLYFHDVSENISREISFEDAQKFILSGSSFSPDGFEVTRGKSGGGLFFGSYDYRTRYLKKNTYFKKLDLNIGEDNYYNFQFIGWIVK